MTAPAPTFRDRLLDALERALSSAGEQFLAVVVAVGGVSGLAGLPWALGLATAGGAFVISVLLTVAAYTVGAATLPYWVDLGVRIAKSFAASLLATLGGGAVDIRVVSWVDALNVAALAAFLTLLKGLLSPNAHLSASLLPTPTVARLNGVTVDAGVFKR